MEPDLKFDLPFLDVQNLNTTTLNFELETCNKVVDNPIKEDEFNEHEFFGLLDDELLNSEGEDENHHFDFEINNSENVFNNKLEFQFSENKCEFQPIVLSTPKIIVNKTTCSIFNKTKFVFPNPHSTSKSFTIWFFVLKLCLTHLTRQINRSLEDRFIYFLTVYFLISCK